MRLYNTLGKRIETFEPVNPDRVTVFTCGPSIYQRAHIGNWRTFLFEDVLVRYLEYVGYTVERGMNLTDIEDKAIAEAANRGLTVRTLTDRNIAEFLDEMHRLKIKVPDYLPRASDYVESAVRLITRLVERGVAYWHEGNVYFDPLKFPGFGELYGLDMSRWPRTRRRFHKDTYPGMRWNRGDFILWHGCPETDDVCYDSEIGPGRPAWNIQDPSMISAHFDETLSIYCGGIDNLIRHHDYSRAVLNSVRPYPMARYWLHCRHLHVHGKKMSKSLGNIYYTDDLVKRGYDYSEIRFFLIYGHYGEELNYADRHMEDVARRLRTLRRRVSSLAGRAGGRGRGDPRGVGRRIRDAFVRGMDDDLNVRQAFDRVDNLLATMSSSTVREQEAAKAVDALRRIDQVLQVIF
jgi:cysteinyl-tRNA synthetase